MISSAFRKYGNYIMIKQNSVVSIAYTLTNQAGEVLDQAELVEPLLYLHGFENIIPGLERALEGLKPGDHKDVTVQPADGYGEEDPNLYVKVPISAFPKSAKIEVGASYRMESPDGDPMVFTVQAVTGETIHMNGNHPLAGQVLNFKIEVINVREATKQELEHGHVHGAGGHHH